MNRSTFSFFHLIALCLTVVFSSCNNEKTLPIYGHREVKITKLADGKEKIDTVYQQIPDFSFLNQDSVAITQDNFKGKVYIADFFFTSCPTICPTMHRNLKMIYDEYKSNPDVMYLSHTIDYKHDQPSILKKYAKKLGVDDKIWQFAHGEKDKIYQIAEKDYLVAVGEDKAEKGGYVHQGYLVLIDKDRRIRGAYDGTDSTQVEQLKKDVSILLKEYK